jgi:hypothetical protein
MCKEAKIHEDENEGTHYPDLEAPDGPMGDIVSVKRIPGMKKIAPKIQWGKEYRSWPIKKRLKFAERLADTMNHAADVIQGERDKLLVILKEKEEKLKASIKQYLAQGEMIHNKLAEADAEKQELYKQIVDLNKKVKLQARKIKVLETRIGDNDR